MTSHNDYLLDPNETRRERMQRRGHIAALHTWWGRRSLSTARAAVFKALAPHSDDDTDLLKRICVQQPRPSDLETARQRIKAEFARRNPQDDSDDTLTQRQSGGSAVPRILDMFAGGGSIPLEALRLGAQAYAADLDPTAYLIELCTVSYPQRYAHLSKAFVGSGDNDTWAGLSQEIRHWASWVQEHANQELRQYYPQTITLEIEGQQIDVEPIAYIWARTIACPTCGAHVPLGRPIKLAEQAGRALTLVPQLESTSKYLSWTIAEHTGNSAEKASTYAAHRSPQCLACGLELTFEQVRGARPVPVIAGLVYRRGHDAVEQYASQQMLSNIHLEPDAELIHKGVLSLHEDSNLEIPDEPLPTGRAYVPPQYGFTTFGDLFTTRQHLTLLMYCRWIRRSNEVMTTLGMSTDRATAITGYLGLLVSDFAQRRSAFSTWNPRAKAPTPIFTRPVVPMTWHFAEASPFAGGYSFTDRADQIVSVVEECSGVGHPAQVTCASATQLPFEDNYFDAVVTDPPYFDAVPYADLSAFFYVWLKRSVGTLFTQVFTPRLPSSNNEVVVAPHRHGNDPHMAMQAYLNLMRQALHEAFRVLKPDSLMTLVYNSHESTALQTVLKLTQEVGFELFSADRIEPNETLGPSRRDETEFEPEGVGKFLLAFRKTAAAAQLTEPTVDAAILLELAGNDQSTLYAGLAELIEGELTPHEIAQHIPADFQGTEHDKLVEYVATVGDPEQFLVEELGKHTLRRLAISRGWMQDDAREESPAQVILRHLGFNVPGQPQKRVTATTQHLKELVSQIRISTATREIEGYVGDGMKHVEAVIRDSVFAWARAICETDANVHLRNILKSAQSSGRHISLERLTMGDVIKLFCELPDYIARDERLCALSQELVGRPHIYRVGKQKSHLDELVALRNRVTHNAEVVDASNADELRQVGAEGLEKAVDVLTRLKDAGAIPLVAQPIRETRDIFNRRTTTLKMEDGTLREIFMAAPLTLGENYLFLAARNNPRAINPLLIPL